MTILVVSGCDDGKEPPRSPGEETPAANSQAMAERFAPKVWLAEDDEYGPGDASRFIAESELLFDTGAGQGGVCAPTQVAAEVEERQLGGQDTAYTTRGCVEDGPTYASDKLTDVIGGGKGFFLDLDDNDDVRRGDGAAAPVYWEFYRKDADTTAIVYWLHYAYNDFINNHEGDWERVAVQFVDGKPKGVTFWKHNEDPCLVEWGDLEHEGDHPVTYSAAGSHGSYDRSGTYDAAPGPGHPVTDVTSQGTAWATWGKARSVVKEPWWGYRGLWGEQPGPEGTNGPRGPYPGRSEAVFATEPCAAPMPTPAPHTPGTVPPSAPPRIPDPFLDYWVATEPMTRPGFAKPYYVRLFLWGDELPSGQDTEGKSEYSTSFEALDPDLACSGHLRFVETNPDKVVLQETEDIDVYDNCPNEGTITLTLSGDTLVYNYTGGGGAAHTTLRRQ